jgi:simple sugar transport system permease protein
MQLFTATLFASTLRISSSLIWTAMGVCISHQAGVFNFAVEGFLLFASFFAVLFTVVTTDIVLTVVLTVVMGTVISAVFAYLVLHLRADPIIAAFGVNLLALGGTAYLLKTLLGQTGGAFAVVKLPRYRAEWLYATPVVGPVLNGQTIPTYLSLLLLPTVYILLYRTSFGIRLRAAGERPDAAMAAGIDVRRLQFVALCLTGAMCGMGGADMALGFLSMFTENMTVGRGVMAFAAALFGRNLPVPVFFTALFFGFAEAFCNRLQAFNVPTDFILTLPYLITVVALAASSARVWRALWRQRLPAESSAS